MALNPINVKNGAQVQAQYAAVQNMVPKHTSSAPQHKEAVSIEEVIGELENISTAFNKRLSFSVNEKLESVVVKVIDKDTDKVIREIPPKELQNVHEKIREVMGILFDEQA